MKYQLSIEIDKPRDETIKIFTDPKQIPHWQRGFVSIEPISGDPGQSGSKSKLLYQWGKRKREMIEVITHRDLPEQFHATYEAGGVYNVQENYFTEIEGGKTLWRSVSEFRFSGFFMKALGTLMPGAFKKQSYKFMTDFKNLVEHGTSVAK
ncbi:SRPBCC family protein [Cryomorphaceae bacterium]|nr:SRPBCC family protein [Cryomorphaceae bacterium]